MEIQIDREIMVKALSQAIGVVDKRGTMPILANVLIVANGSAGVYIAATDLETSFWGWCPVKFIQGGAVCVNAAALLNLIKSLPKKTQLTLIAGGKNGLDIQVGTARYKVHGLPVDGFPPVPVLNNDFSKAVPLDGQVIRDMIKKTIFSTSPDTMQYHLAGIFWETLVVDDKPLLRFTSTDGHRLSYIDRPCPGRFDLGDGVLVPTKAMGQIYRLLDKQASVTVSLTDNILTVQTEDDCQVAVRLMDKKFPDYRRIVPKHEIFQHMFTVDRLELIGSVTRVSQVSSEQFKGVIFNLKGNSLEVSFDNPELGKAAETLGIINEKGSSLVVFGFNARYLLEPLKEMTGDKVTMASMAPDAPWEIAGGGADRHYKVIVMPMGL